MLNTWLYYLDVSNVVLIIIWEKKEKKSDTLISSSPFKVLRIKNNPNNPLDTTIVMRSTDRQDYFQLLLFISNFKLHS